MTATSEDLRYIFQVGDQFFLHIEECSAKSMDIVTGRNPSGDEVTHLVLFSPLTSPNTGCSRFMLASLVNVTDFVQDAAQVPDLETVHEESGIERYVPTPAINLEEVTWTARSYELRPEELLGGCCLEAKGHPRSALDNVAALDEPRVVGEGSPRYSEDVWLAIAKEERSKQGPQSNGCDTPKVTSAMPRPRSSSLDSRRKSGSCVSASASRSSSDTTMDEVLEDFISSLQKLYSDFFLLARSPLDDKYYEICNVSPSVYASGEYMTGHLTHTSPNVVEELSERLGVGHRFRTTIRWGSQGVQKQLYCIPLFGQRSVIWICILIEMQMPVLW